MNLVNCACNSTNPAATLSASQFTVLVSRRHAAVMGAYGIMHVELVQSPEFRGFPAARVGLALLVVPET